MRRTSIAAAVAALAMLAAATARAEGDLSVVPRIKLDELKKDFDKLLVIDVRSADAYRAGHIAGAVSMPGSSLSTNAPRLKVSKKPIVTYCA
jgi:rhodanese-related sulfurtransferase